MKAKPALMGELQNTSSSESLWKEGTWKERRDGTAGEM
jgi:hypothetical protein